MEASMSAAHTIQDEWNGRQQADAGVPRKALPDRLQLRRAEVFSLPRPVAVSVKGQSRQMKYNRARPEYQIDNCDDQFTPTAVTERRPYRSHT
jgi:hypothetical protein